MPIRAVMIAAECEPYAKTGGLGDVVDALARALGRLPASDLTSPIEVFLPRYRWLATDGPASMVRLPDPRSVDGLTDVRIIDVAADGYRIRLVDYPPAFDRDGIYGAPGGGDYPDNAWRFGLFGRAALEALRRHGRPVDVIHAHDWHACAAIVARDQWYASDPVLGSVAVLLTVHNLRYHGWVPRSELGQLGLQPGVGGVVAPDAAGLDLLWSGIDRAELVNTVSPGYAAEARTPEFGFGLDGPLRAKGDRFFGILNGLDSRVWDPAADPAIPARYSVADRSGKLACRSNLLGRVGFDAGDPSPVLAMIGRLDDQKGFDIVADATPALLALGSRLVVLGSGDPAVADVLRSLAALRPDRIALIEAFDRDLARQIYAGCDLFLMPSRYEPCGQGQMIAMRYGTPPVVHATGGLRDTVIDERDHPGRGTGWVFHDPTPDALTRAAREAIAAYRRGSGDWQGVVVRGMAADFDWSRGPARQYLDAYLRAIAVRRGVAPSRPGSP